MMTKTMMNHEVNGNNDDNDDKVDLSRSADIAWSILSPGRSLNASFVGMNTVPWVMFVIIGRCFVQIIDMMVEASSLYMRKN